MSTTETNFSQIKAIETKYDNHNFRSRLEARWAVFFNSSNIIYTYEPEGFNLGALGAYLPDFYLPELKLWVETKPFKQPFKKIYMAGKITKNGWREQIVPNIRNVSFFESDLEIIPEYPLNYNGPFFLSCDHGCSHGQNTHGVGEGCGGYSGIRPVDYDKYVITKSLSQVLSADSIFIWVDNLSCYGSLIECGVAHARQKDIRIGVSNKIKQEICLDVTENPHLQQYNGVGKHDLWFLEGISNKFVWSDNARSAFDDLYSDCITDEILKLRSVARSKREKYSVVYGEPSYYEFCGNTNYFHEVFTKQYKDAVEAATSQRFERRINQ